MTISIWRYSHFALAISASVFLVLAALTGIILAFQPINEMLKTSDTIQLNRIDLVETIGVFKDKYPEVIDFKVANNYTFIASVFTKEKEFLEGYFNPLNGNYLGRVQKTSAFLFSNLIL